MHQVKSYTCFLTEKADIVVTIPALGKEQPQQAELIYAGGEHALFYKTSNQSIILDYLNEGIQPFLKKADRILLFEISVESQEIIQDYFVPVKHVKKLPELSLELKVV